MHIPQDSEAPREFPQELLDLVIDNIGDTVTLGECRLVDRRFDKRCMRHMFSHVTITDERQAWRLHGLILDGSSISSYVQELSVIGDKSLALTYSTGQWGSESVACLLRALPCVTSIHISLYSMETWHPALAAVLVDLFYLGQITKATFKSASIPDNVLRACGAAVSSLTIEGTWVTNGYSPSGRLLQDFRSPSNIQHLRLVIPSDCSLMIEQTFPVDVSRIHTLELYEKERYSYVRSHPPAATALSGFLPAFRFKLTRLVCQCPFLGASDAVNLNELHVLESVQLLARIAEAPRWVAGFLSKSTECRSIQKFGVTICDDSSQYRIYEQCSEALKELDNVLHAAIFNFPSVQAFEVQYITSFLNRLRIMSSIFLDALLDQRSINTSGSFDLGAYTAIEEAKLAQFESRMTKADVEHCIRTSFSKLQGKSKLKLTVKNHRDIPVRQPFHSSFRNT
ncbi:hypothetical protein H0H93_012250 [Arthromyces matolae]|nr:hypothetical protein H0H93_012250 [Arthromyces matolae]